MKVYCCRTQEIKNECGSDFRERVHTKFEEDALLIRAIQHCNSNKMSLTFMAAFIKIYGHRLYGAHGMPLCTFYFGEQHMDPQRMVVYTNFPTHVYSLRGIYW